MMQRYALGISPRHPAHLVTSQGTASLCGLAIADYYRIPADLAASFPTCPACSRIAAVMEGWRDDPAPELSSDPTARSLAIAAPGGLCR